MLKQFFIRFIASMQFSCVPKAVSRKYPSPAGPNPTPGVPTTCASFKSLSKNCHEPMPCGVFNQIYGELIPPTTSNPTAVSPSRITFAF